MKFLGHHYDLAFERMDTLRSRCHVRSPYRGGGELCCRRCPLNGRSSTLANERSRWRLSYDCRKSTIISSILLLRTNSRAVSRLQTNTAVHGLKLADTSSYLPPHPHAEISRTKSFVSAEARSGGNIQHSLCVSRGTPSKLVMS